MDEQSAHVRLRTAEPGQRRKVYEQIYDEVYEIRYHRGAPMQLPGPRRRKRISAFKAVIGQGHGRILEIGCGAGDLSHALRGHAREVIGVDVSSKAVESARMRRGLWQAEGDPEGRVEFLQMHAAELQFPDNFFDYVVSTSVIEHLHPDDVTTHLGEVWRVLIPGGRYLVWCPNRLGHHQDRDVHLSMFSYGELMQRMKGAGFRNFQAPLLSRGLLVRARFKVLLENLWSRLRIKILWSHLGIRNIFLVASK